MDQIISNLKESISVLNEFQSDQKNIIKIRNAADMMIESLRNGGKIISFGNGGSLCDAMHFAEELTGRFRKSRPPIAAMAISDASHITCIANDFGFDEVFSRFIEANGKNGDVVLAISTSGNSVNVIKACEVAREKGIKIIALTGKTGGLLARIADVELRINHAGFSDRIQEVHIVIIHILIELIEKGLSTE
jgi:D-sedoheptulose 7-phosphate isomerase